MRIAYNSENMWFRSPFSPCTINRLLTPPPPYIELNELESVYLRGSPCVTVSEEEGRLLASALVLWGLPHSTQLGTGGPAVVQYLLARQVLSS